MGTRSTIAIQNSNGTVTGIYCHWDGYLEHNGKLLASNYTTEEKVYELMALGDLSTLGETIGAKTDFNDAAKGQCVAYGRDRGETDINCTSFDSHAELVEQIGQGFDYLYVPGKGWSVARGKNAAVPLEKELLEVA